MIVAFIGTHSIGKTTTCQRLQSQLGDDWTICEDVLRKQTSLLNISRPACIDVKDPVFPFSYTGRTASAFGIMLEWVLNCKKHGLIDLGPQTIMAFYYYLMMVYKAPVSPYIQSLHRHLSEQIDYFIYLNPKTVPLEEDGLRSSDPFFRLDIDEWVLRSLEELSIPEHRIIRPQSHSVSGRVQEILSIINSQI